MEYLQGKDYTFNDNAPQIHWLLDSDSQFKHTLDEEKRLAKVSLNHHYDSINHHYDSLNHHYVASYRILLLSNTDKEILIVEIFICITQTNRITKYL